MRNAIILTIAILILFITGYWQIRYIEETSIYAMSDVEYTMNLVQNNNFDGANTHIIELEKTWGNMRNIWSIFIMHDEIDDIETALVNFKTYIKLKNKEESLVYSELLKQNLGHISKKQKITIENVF
ncbi:MAG: hypothetical protein K0R72_1151 [Clostridia bacterium]|jgi:hypothetical protein|nr:hypothetical protein [Clostridia bacterium]